MGNILLTGFEPFGGSNVNPSIQACQKLEGLKINGYDIMVEEIPLHYEKVEPTLLNAIDTHKPKIIICTGQSGSPQICLERVAINIADARIAYNCGTKPTDKIIKEDGAVAYFSKLPIRKILKALLSAKIPSRISNSAGTFGCNHIFYDLMYHMDKTSSETPGGFIHVPSLPEQVLGKRSPSMTLDLITKALRIAVDTTTSIL